MPAAAGLSRPKDVHTSDDDQFSYLTALNRFVSEHSGDITPASNFNIVNAKVVRRTQLI